jgi:hypothetical protein
LKKDLGAYTKKRSYEERKFEILHKVSASNHCVCAKRLQ